MKTAQISFTRMLTMSALLPVALLSMPAQAQQHNPPQASHYSAAQGNPKIDGFDVEEVRRLVPGTDLHFELYGTPGGLASLRIAGANRNLTLVETEAGRYQGIHTISLSDKIVARSPVTANLRVGDVIASEVLNESLQVGVGEHSMKFAPGPLPAIERFTAMPAADLHPGQELNFTVLGTPGGKVHLTIDGVKGKIILPEANKGQYTGSYTIKSRDRIASNSVVTANLLLGAHSTSFILNQALQSKAAPPVRTAAPCSDCGTIEAVNLVEVKGNGGYLGAIGGGVLGGLLGNQIGGGSGKKVATVAGVVGGALAGRAIEANTRDSHHYEVRIRMQNGAAETLTYPNEPGYRVGDKVKLNDGVIARNP